MRKGQFNVILSLIEFKELKIIEFKQNIEKDPDLMGLLKKCKFQRIHQNGINISDFKSELIQVLPLIAWIQIQQLFLDLKNNDLRKSYQKKQQIFSAFSDIKFITLKELDLGNTRCCNIQFLSNTCFPSLKKLFLNRCDIINVKALAKMTSPNLHTIKLNDNKIINPQILTKANFHRRIGNLDITIQKNTYEWILKCPFEHINYYFCEVTPLQGISSIQTIIKKQKFKIEHIILKKYSNCTTL